MYKKLETSKDKDGGIRGIQTDIDKFKTQLDDLCDNELPRLGAASPDRLSVYKRADELQQSLSMLCERLATATIENETMPTRKYEKLKKEEQSRLVDMQQQLEDITQQLEPDEVEEDYFSILKSPVNGAGNKEESVKTKTVRIKETTPTGEEDNDQYDDEEESDEYDDDEYDDEDDDDNHNELPTVCVVEALCDFNGEEEDDLSFKKGDHIDITDKSEDGWWTGRDKLGKTGVVPSTLVQLVNEKENSNVIDTKPGSIQSLRKQESGKDLWNKLKGTNSQENVVKASVSDVLQAMKAVPSGFRNPTLGYFYKKIEYRTSGWIIPKMSTSNINFKDLYWDPINKKIRPWSVNICRTFTLMSAKFVPPVGAGVEILSRHVFLSIWNEEKILSNIHLVRAIYMDKDGSWAFNVKIGKSIASLFDGDFIARINSDDRRISLLLELNYTYIRTSTGEQSDMCCGWASLPLYEADGTPIGNKNFELKLHGGTPFDKNITLDPTLEQLPPQSLMQSLVRTNRQPRIVVKATSYNRLKKEQFDMLPETIVTCQNYARFIGLFRQHAAVIFCKDVVIPSGLLCDPILSYFPRTLDYPDLMDALNSRWEVKTRISLNRSQRRDLHYLQTLFKQCFMESSFALMTCSHLPPFKWANERVEKARFHFIQSYIQPMDLVANLLSPNIQYKPLNLNKLSFNVSSKFSQHPNFIHRDTKTNEL